MFSNKGKGLPIIITIFMIAIIIYLFATLEQPLVVCEKRSKNDLDIVVSEILCEKNLTISTAESCTGGMVAATLISYPGISSVFKEGIVTYSNEAKEKFGAIIKDLIHTNNWDAELDGAKYFDYKYQTKYPKINKILRPTLLIYLLL